MVIHPPMLYLGYVGFSVPFAFALGALMMRYPGEKWIKITRVWTMVTWLFLTVRHLAGNALGLCGAGLGRLLGMGPGGERQLHAVADGDGLSALGDDAGEEGHDEELECVADLHHLPADAAGHAADARGAGQFGSRICAVVDRHVVHGLHGDRAGGVHLHLYLAAQPPEERAASGVAGEPRVELPVQQSGAACRVLRDSVGHALSDSERVRGGQQSHGGRAVVQPRGGADWIVSAVSDGRGSAAALAGDVVQEHSRATLCCR